MISLEGYLIKYPEVQSEGKHERQEEEERRAQRERERQARQLMRADVSVNYCLQFGCQNAVLVSRKFSLNCLLISISTWIPGRKTSFYFFL